MKLRLQIRNLILLTCLFEILVPWGRLWTERSLLAELKLLDGLVLLLHHV